MLLGVRVWIIAGCSGTRALHTDPVGVSDPDPTRQSIVHNANALLGTPYRYGGSRADGLDCSGLVQLAYTRAGVRVPRDTIAQFRAGIAQSRLRPGDLVFYRIDSPEISHVGIYVGNGEMIHASSGSRHVRRVRIDSDYWRQRWAGAVTLLHGTTRPAPTAPASESYLAWTPRISGG